MEEGLREVLDGHFVGGQLCEDNLQFLMTFTPDALGITNMRLGRVDGKLVSYISVCSAYDHRRHIQGVVLLMHDGKFICVSGNVIQCCITMSTLVAIFNNNFSQHNSHTNRFRYIPNPWPNYTELARLTAYLDSHVVEV